MGCKKIESEEQLSEILNDNNYLGQEKIDGVRGVMQFLDDGRMIITTRGSTKANPTIPIDISHRLPHIVKYKVKSLAGTVIDGELYDPCLTSSQLAGILNYRSTVPVPPTIVFRAFDLLYYRDLPIFPMSNFARISRLEHTVSHMSPIPIEFVPYILGGGKEQYLYDLLARGMEGMVFKNLSKGYEFGDSKKSAKPAGFWYKYKKKDTVDVTIIGSREPDKYYTDPETRSPDYERLTQPYINGWIGSIEFRFTDEDGNDHVGSCSGITNELRAELSYGRLLKSEYVGKTMEVEFMEKTTDGNLRHPRFVRIREDIEHENG